VIHNQSIGVATTSKGLNNVDGILGIGPVDLTAGPFLRLNHFFLFFLKKNSFPHSTGTVSRTPSVPTVTDNLFSQGTIQSDSLGISYVPSTSATHVANGEIQFGGTDSSKYVYFSIPGSY
jgi:hypothetical protein